MKSWKSFLLVIPWLCLGCGTLDNDSVPPEKPTEKMNEDNLELIQDEEKELIIASVLPAQKESLVLVGGSCGEGAWNPLYIYKTKESSDWMIWHTDFRIEGFEEVYEEGFEYCIKIRIRCWRPDPEIADHNPRKCELVEVISKEKKDSVHIPAEFLGE